MNKISKLLLTVGLPVLTFFGSEINAIAEYIIPTLEIVERSQLASATAIGNPGII